VEETEVSGLLKVLNLHLSPEQLQDLSVLIFVAVYVMIVFERFFHRTTAALLGASAVMVVGVIPPQVAWRSIDYNTIFLLFGMMNIVTVLAHSGFFELMAVKALRMTGPSPVRIMLMFTVLTALFSAFLDNVTTVLFMTPVVIRVTKLLGLDPVPYVISVVLASNTGGTATLIGDPPNIIIGSIAHKSFNDFLIHVAPHALVGFVVGLLVNFLYMRITGAFRSRGESARGELDLKVPEVDRSTMRKGVAVFVLTVVLFMMGHKLSLEPGVIALLTSTLLLLWTRMSPAYVMERIEWATLMFFAGLFIVVGSLEHTGVFARIANRLGGMVGSDPDLGLWVVGAFSALVSGFVDNIPFTMSMAYVLKDMTSELGANLDTLWWALSIGACLGGNFTLIGASANIVASAIAEREGYRISFLTFLRYGTPVALFSTGSALLSLYLFRF
jgi:Na+/H+ antiporter NhaD/arsenite permease-like protein